MPAHTRLNAAALPVLAARGLPVPSYRRDQLPGVVHLGLGAFHRAHQALVCDALLARGDDRWGILGVAMRSTQLADALREQDGLYAVQIASEQGAHWRLCGAVWQTCVAQRERDAVVRAIAAPSTRWITLTVTEKAYGPALAELLVQGLSARWAAGLAGLTIASCDNLSGNGSKLEAMCQALVQEQEQKQDQGAALGRWMAGHCAFPNSMVDRIVPAATPARLAAAQTALGLNDQAALGTEAFWEWVIERRFADASDADTLSAVGVTVVDDVAPFEEAKLRLLNASHSALACLGAVLGLGTVDQCIAQNPVRQFVHDFITLDVGPQLRRPDVAAYRDALLARFANPALAHSVHQIATDSSVKLPQRWVPSVLAGLARQQPMQRLAFCAAAWMRYLRGMDEQGRVYQLNDPMADKLQALAQAHAGDAPASVAALGTMQNIWGGSLAQHQAWHTEVTQQLERINRQGIFGALAGLAISAAALL